MNALRSGSIFLLRAESDYTFTADSENMKVEVAFTFDATSLDGKQLVTFEELEDCRIIS